MVEVAGGRAELQCNLALEAQCMASAQKPLSRDILCCAEDSRVVCIHYMSVSALATCPRRRQSMLLNPNPHGPVACACRTDEEGPNAPREDKQRSMRRNLPAHSSPYARATTATTPPRHARARATLPLTQRRHAAARRHVSESSMRARAARARLSVSAVARQHCPTRKRGIRAGHGEDSHPDLVVVAGAGKHVCARRVPRDGVDAAVRVGGELLNQAGRVAVPD